MQTAQLTLAPVRPMPMALPTSASDGDPQALSDLVAAIYDAALDPDQWPTVLDSCRQFVGGLSAAIFAKDLAGMAGGIFYTDGLIDARWGQLYFEKYARLDPLTGAHLLSPLEVPAGTTDFMEMHEFRQSRFYKEWAEPQGIVDFVTASIEKKGAWAALFGVFRHREHGLVDETTKERMRLLVPHIRRAVLIGKVIENGQQQASTLGEAVDGLASGLFLVDAGGRVLHSNPAGRSLLGRGAIEVVGGRLVASNRDASAQLAEVFEAAGHHGGAVTQGGVSVALPSDAGDDYVAHVLPLSSGQRQRVGAPSAAVAAVFVRGATLDLPAAPEVMARTYGLTLGELRVLDAIVHVGGVPETADTLGVAETTVKTHLHRVFSKTGTTRQADLVRLVAGFASPLAR